MGTSIRQGARSVTQIEIHAQTCRGPHGQHPLAGPPWPAHALHVKLAGRRAACATGPFSPRLFLPDERGALRAIRAVRADWGSGGLTCSRAAGTELPARLVLLAMGFLHPEHTVLEDLGVDIDERGNCASTGYRTSREGVFVAGDMRRGQSLVVWAITEGRECAREVDEYLSGRPSLLDARDKSRSDVVLAS